MNLLAEFSGFGQVAFASYAGLTRGMSTSAAHAALVAADMSEIQAEEFLSNWRLIDQFSNPNGLFAVVFQSAGTGKHILAIRGTELSLSLGSGLDLAADTFILAGVPQYLNPQYDSLSRKVRDWLADGTLTPGFAVAGHSLGGYLAGAVGVDFSPYVSAVYQYNAPGFGGIIAGNAYEALKQGLGLGNLAVLPDTYNLRGSRGLSLIASLGAQFAPPTAVEIEGAPGLGLDNHVIARISDSLSVYALLSQFNPDLSFRQISELIAASSIRDSDTLERTLFPLLDALGMEPVALENRDALFGAISGLQSEAAWGRSFIEVQTLLGLSASDLYESAIAPGGISYRYALQGLDPYVILGEAGASLDSGDLTNQYLADRAEMLYWKNQWFIKDSDTLFQGDTVESRKYFGSSLNDASESAVTFTVRGRRIEAVGIPVLRTFGSDSDDIVIGSDPLAGDHIYGGGGNDTLDGQGGTDYLEGNSGDDRLQGGFDDDVLVGGSGFDTYVYNEGDGFDTAMDADGSGQIVYNGRALGGGSKIGEDAYRDQSGVEYLLLDNGAGGQSLLIDGNVHVENFENGDLGILLDGVLSPPEAPESSASHFYLDSIHPQDYDPRDGSQYGFLLNLFGSSGDDLFQTSGEFDVFGRNGNDVAIIGSEVAYDNTIDLGAGDDFIDASASGGGGILGRLAGGGGSDLILGSSGVDVIWGDNYFAVSQELFGLPSPRKFGTYSIDGVNYNAELEAGESIFGFLPAGYGIFAADVDPVTLGGDSSRELIDAVLVPDGAVVAGSLSEIIFAVLGSSPEFDDYIDAGDGDDHVFGGSGADEIFGGMGSDVLVGDYGGGSINTPSYRSFQRNFGELAELFGRPGDDHLYGGDGNDHLVDTDGGNEILVGEAGNDTIVSREDFWKPEDGRGAHNSIDGGDGDDNISVVNATGGFDAIDGGEGDDTIEVHSSRWSLDEDEDGVPDSVGSSAGRAIVFGGAGNDVLRVFADDGIVEGGAGDDDYTVSGEQITIADSGGEDTLHLSMFDLSFIDASMEAFPAMDPEDEAELDASDQFSSTVVMREGGDLLVVSRSAHDGSPVAMGQLRISGWFAGTESRIEHIVYDGAEELSLTPAQLEAWGGWHQGGGGADELVYASEYSDRAFGGGGDDQIYTGDGADRISGGKGNDELYGGAGNDTYYYAEDDGNDLIEETSGFDEIRFGPGILETDVAVTLEDSGLAVTLASGRIDIAGGSRADPGIEQLRFADGGIVSVAALLGPEPIPPEEAEPPASDGGSGEGATPSASGAGDAGGGVVASNAHVEPIVVAHVPEVSILSESPPSLVDAPNLSLPSGLPQSALQALGIESPGEQSADATGEPAGAALDPETLLEAVRAFDEAPTAASTAGRTTAEQPPESDATPAITSWALTNALLDFHLSRPDSDGATDGTADFFDGGAILARSGLGTGALPVGFTAFGDAARRLETFSGLQEGLARLG